MKTLVLVAALLCVGATALIQGPLVQEAESVHWRQLLHFDIPTEAFNPLPGASGLAPSAIGFRVSDTVQGGAVIALVSDLHTAKVGVFVGLNTPNEFINAPYQDLRVEFTLFDGSTRLVKPASGSGTAMLFQSPDDAWVTRIRSLDLYVNSTAEWTR